VTLSSLSFDLVISFFLALPSTQRRSLNKSVATLLNTGGLYIVECFSPGQDEINKKNGTRNGPRDLDLLVSAEDLARDFDGEDVEILVAEEIVRELLEGSFHRMKEAAVTRFVCRKRGRTAWTDFGSYVESLGEPMKGSGNNADFEAMLEAALAAEEASAGAVPNSPPLPAKSPKNNFVSWVDSIFDEKLVPTTTSSSGVLPVSSDAYLKSASEILRFSLDYARTMNTCPYCWFRECKCDRLSVSGQTTTTTACDPKVRVVLLIHPTEFLRGSSTCKLLRDSESVHYEYLVVGMEGTGERLDELAASSPFSTYILYPSDDSVTTKIVAKEIAKEIAKGTDPRLGSPPLEDKSTTVIVPDGSWKMTEKILAETALQKLNVKTLKIDENVVSGHTSSLLESLNTTSGSGRLSTAEAVAFCLKGLGFFDDASRIFGSVDRLSAIFEDRKAAIGLEGAIEVDADGEKLKCLQDVAARLSASDIPAGLRWCAVCGAAMASAKRMHVHLCGKRHLQCVLAAAKGGNAETDLSAEDIFAKYSVDKMNEGKVWIDPPDVALATLFDSIERNFV
jgi:DTW domain-containing protein YfiP